MSYCVFNSKQRCQNAWRRLGLSRVKASVNQFNLILFVALFCGCAGPRFNSHQIDPSANPSPEITTRAAETLSELYPAHYKAIQRAVITVSGKQFVCDGVLDVSPKTGWRLGIVSALGLVSEVQITPAGAVELLRITPLMREDWSCNCSLFLRANSPTMAN